MIASMMQYLSNWGANERDDAPSEVPQIPATNVVAAPAAIARSGMCAAVLVEAKGKLRPPNSMPVRDLSTGQFLRDVQRARAGLRRMVPVPERPANVE